MNTDEKYMMRAIELAKRGEGLTRPNPPVGAVLVQNGEVIAEGWHEKAGGAHAEVNCLKSAIGDLKSAILYVTLEPCSTQGQTPPCTDLIREKGIGRVVVSMMDPNPLHAGEGLKILEETGVEVVSGICETEGRELIAPFEKFITTGMPYVTLKLALTLDGRIADSTGDSRWITGAEARERVQEMRRRADAVMVGAGTVRADDPSLLPRPDEGRCPWRVVVGKNIPADSKVLTDAAAEQTIIFEMEGHCPQCPQTTRTRVAITPSLQINSLRAGLQRLADEYNVMHVLCEGGGTLAASLVAEGLVDEFAFFIAPKLLGSDGLPGFSKSGGLMADMTNLKFQTFEQVGDDILIKAKVEE
jgi:diaminohydroxyphosphoribosylaminopyrimidine deaminase/5-amino-6-(5-phosphoribosylamino)uracil reductase